MRRFAHATVLAMAISAPALAGVLMNHSPVSVLGAPGGCSSNCAVGAVTSPSGTVGQGAVSSAGQAQGGRRVESYPLNPNLDVKQSGTFAVRGDTEAGHNDTDRGTLSGNFTSIPGKGHCTGSIGACG